MHCAALPPNGVSAQSNMFESTAAPIEPDPPGVPYYRAGNLGWKVFDRDTTCLAILEHALDVLEAKGSLPIAMTLARNAGQYFAERTRHAAGVSLRKLAGDLHDETAPLFPPAWGRQGHTELLFQDADRLKHYRPGEPTTVRLCEASVGVVLAVALTDCLRLGLPVSERARAWLAREVVRARSFGFMMPPPPGLLRKILQEAAARGRRWMRGENPKGDASS